MKNIKRISQIKGKKFYGADLHNHTTGSDGTQSPLMMLVRAYNRGIKTVSISDHDSCKGYTELKKDLLKRLEKLEALANKEDLTEKERHRIDVKTKLMLKILENVKIIPAAELITSYKGHIIEILGYGVDPDILQEEIEKIHTNLVPSGKILLEGTKRIIQEKNLTFDWFVIENRADFKKLFFHELIKHPENKQLYEGIEGDTEEEKAINFSKKYLENKESPLYVDMNQTEERGVKQIRASFLSMIEKNKDKITFDENVIKNSHAISGEFYTEVIKHPENLKYLSGDVDNLKKFIYGELYNHKSPFFIDMSPSRPSTKDTIDAIHKAGGKAFLAHPGRYTKQFDVKEEMEEGTLLEGLDGVEVFYPIHDEEMINYLLSKCKEKGLNASGGSDDHLAPKDGVEYKMGTVDIPDIPETRWIQEYLKTGRDYLNEAKELKNMIDRLRKLKSEKVSKQKTLLELEAQQDVENTNGGEEYGED